MDNNLSDNKKQPTLFMQFKGAVKSVFSEVKAVFGNQDQPNFREVKNRDYVYYGMKNDYPYYLIDIYSESTFHKAIVDYKVSYICGNGWGINTEGLNTEHKALALKMLQQPFNLDSDLNDATLRWCLDLEIFNGLCIKGIWSTDGKTASLSYIDMANIRTNVDESSFFYTQKWVVLGNEGLRKTNQKPEEEKDFRIYTKYDPKNRKGEFIYYWKAPHPIQKVYPIPVYRGACRPIDTDISLDIYFFNTVESGFTPTHLINFYNNEPTQDKAIAIEKKIHEKFTGVGGNRLVVNFARSKDTSADVQTLQMTDSDKQYEAIGKRVQQQIITGHRLSSGMLLGLYREGSLGGRAELQLSEELFQNEYVNGRQKIIESVINELAADFGITQKFYLNRVRRVGYMFSDETIDSVFTPEEKRRYMIDQLGIKTADATQKNPAVELLKNISSISPLVANKVLESLSVGEIRDMAGLSPTPKESVVSTTTTQQFSSHEENELIQGLASIAKDYSKSELIYEREIQSFDEESVRISENEFMAGHFAAEYKANGLERSIIDLLSKDSTLQPEAIAAATKTDIGKINDAISDLVDRKILKECTIKTPTESVNGYEVTELGVQAINEKTAKTSRIKVVYRYGLSFSFKNEEELISTSHPFCVKMVGLSKGGKRWESVDIFALNNGANKKYGMNAWDNRGGWYTKPNTDIHVPHCRHSWIQQLLRIND